MLTYYVNALKLWRSDGLRLLRLCVRCIYVIRKVIRLKLKIIPIIVSFFLTQEKPPNFEIQGFRGGNRSTFCDSF